jgi:amino acid adenylation domain-containing protein
VRAPDSVAVAFDDETLTYRELNERAELVAAKLRALGVGPDVRVGICVERSLEMMVGLLGILKAGGCYVPLDPTYPKERLAFMLEDSEAGVLMTQERLQNVFDSKVPRVFLDGGREGKNSGAGPAPGLSSRSNDLAYVIYTSGSTGKPKGVMVTHRNAVNFFTAMDRVLGMQSGVWLAVTSISFDISVLELFWTLTRGFKVVIHSDAERKRGLSIPEEITRHNVTHLQCTPSLATGLVLAPEALEGLKSLKTLLLGGEALPASLAEQIRREFKGELLNMYGPTETTIWSAVHRVTETGSQIPIGRPIANTEIFIVDRQLQFTPVGVPGELLIGGEGVARGYLNRAELTAEKFINHPFSKDARARLYRTGDLARFRTDGTIEFLGRLDHQVKLRGHRIELGEIESVIRSHENVRECVVVIREMAPGDQRLLAYIVPARANGALANELRHHLEAKLPSYMMPNDFVTLEKLPLTPNGKIDRKALPAPDKTRADSQASFVEPRSEMEREIAKLWQELLHVEQVGLNDNFFDLGGHSLLVVQMQAKLREAFGVQLPIVRLFQHPTVSALARSLGNAPKKVSLKNIRDRGRRQREAFVSEPEPELAA